MDIPYLLDLSWRSISRELPKSQQYHLPNIINNTNHNAYDDSDANQWDSGSEGNHYGNEYTGADSDGDGIGVGMNVGEDVTARDVLNNLRDKPGGISDKVTT